MQKIRLLKKAVLQKNEGSVREKGEELEVNYGRACTLAELGIAEMIGKGSKPKKMVEPKTEDSEKKVESAKRETKVEQADRAVKDDKPTVRGQGRRRTRS